jgi:hypothetical protein
MLLLAAIASASLGFVTKGRVVVYALIAYPFLLLGACLMSSLYFYRMRRAAAVVELVVSTILLVAFVKRWFFSP